VRSLTQDDCHIFCTPAQVGSEFALALRLITEILNRYRFADYRVRLSLRGTAGKYVQDPEKWEQAEAALRAALEVSGVDYYEAEGEAAFYGPKADFMARDVLGREWQLSTIQVDFIQPARLGLGYIGEDGQEHVPVVLHRAVTGSTERFLGVLIEHFAGAFPAWLAPVQAMLVPITDRNHAYCQKLAASLTDAGLRVDWDGGTERMNAKIRKAQISKIPYILVIGDREEEQGGAAVRLRSGEDLGAKPAAEIIALMLAAVADGT
jgi:threonyl-tRNA synthetase